MKNQIISIGVVPTPIIISLGNRLNWLPRCNDVPPPNIINNPISELLIQARFCSQHIVNLPYGCLFLPYVPGYINFAVTNTPLDVFSYPFSGCYMASFQIGNNWYYVHVSTPDCNDVWESFKRNNHIQNLNEFKPRVSIFDREVRVYGLITRTLRKYSIGVERISVVFHCQYKQLGLHCNYCNPTEFIVTDIVEHL